MEQFATLNGKRVIITTGTTVSAMKQEQGVAPDDIILKQEGGSFRPLAANEPIHDKDRLTSVPPVTKGGEGFGLSPWVARDLDLLRRELGGRSAVNTKPTVRGGLPYLAVEITNVRLNERKFDRTAGKLLFLLPQTYPATPPIGVYVNYPYRMQAGVEDHHLLLATAYGAPDLQQLGWYWYCLQPIHASVWRPRVNPEDGHNLLALFGAASHALNS